VVAPATPGMPIGHAPDPQCGSHSPRSTSPRRLRSSIAGQVVRSTFGVLKQSFSLFRDSALPSCRAERGPDARVSDLLRHRQNRMGSTQ
jgi:hypothetical protein